MTEKEKSYAELLYQPNDPELSADRDVTVKKLHAYNNTWIRWTAAAGSHPRNPGGSGGQLRGGAASLLYLWI